MSSIHQAQPSPLPAATFVAAGVLGLVLGIAAGGDAVAFGAVAFFGGTLLALGATRWNLLTWPNALLVFIAVLWLVPIKLYRLPVDLPFHLEIYRVLILLLVAGFVIWSVRNKRSVQGLSASKALFALTAVVLASEIINAPTIDVPGNEGQALKSLSFFLSYVIVFLLFSSTLDAFGQIERIVTILVGGGVIVAVAALYEGYTLYNVFNHLSEWLPGFAMNERDVLDLRGGRLRVHASAQHPIALGAALMMLAPFVVYLIASAKTRLAKGIWTVALALIAAGAAATISRTTVAMGIAMLVVAFMLRRRVLVRLVPFALVLPIFVHTVAPGAIGGILHSFGDQQGTTFLGSLSDRGGESGSGRLADVGPAFDLWSRSPIIGLGLDSPQIATVGPDLAGTGPQTPVPIIFDNQYLLTLVTLGLAGIIAVVWLVWGVAVRFVRAAREIPGRQGDFVAACAAACAAYGASMFFYDSLAYVQVTLVLFITAALGLKTMALADEEAAAVDRAVQDPG